MVKKLALLIFLVGFTALTYEIYGIEVLSLFFTQNIFAASLAIATFLAGLGFSSLAVSLLERHTHVSKASLVYFLLLFVGLYGFLVLTRYDDIPHYLNVSAQGPSILHGFVLAGFLFVPAFCFGGIFPIVNGLLIDDFNKNMSSVEITGWVYLLDILGSLVGTLVAGFYFIPNWGYQKTCLIASTFALLSSALVAPRFTYMGLSLALPVAGYFFLAHAADTKVIQWDVNRFGRILFQEFSPYGTVTVSQQLEGNEMDKALYINYRDMCHTKRNESELSLGLLVAEILPRNSRVLNIGLGCGFTASAIASSSSVDRLDVVEINPVVVKAARLFDLENDYVLANPKVQVKVLNGADYLRQSRIHYDAIIIDIEEVSILYSSPLFTKEYFEYASQRLKSGGTFALWGGPGGYEFQKILNNTMAEVFDFTVVKSSEPFYLHFASDNTGGIARLKNADDGKSKMVLAQENKEINTIDNQVLKRHFNTRTLFNLPSAYQEEYLSEE